MRKYYVFHLKREFVSLYHDTPSTLFHILKQIKNMDKKEISYGFTLLNQLIRPLNKEALDRELFLKLHRDASYAKVGEKHCINQLYKDEVSNLEIRRVYVKIETNKDISSFFSVLMHYSANYFVCDFDHQDYFFLNELKVLV